MPASIDTIPIQQIIQNAAEAMQRGDKHAARYWAQMAASKSPKIEEPWLILAAVSNPHASIEYLKQALLIDPDSPRAMRGMRWAQARLAKQLAQPPAAAQVVLATQPALATVVPSVRIRPAPARRKASVGLTPAQRRKRLWGLALVSPWLIGFLIFKLAPILASLVLSLTSWPLLDPEKAEFIGLANYARILGDPDAFNVLVQTLAPAFVLIPVQIGASVLLATLLSQKGLKMRNTVRSLFFLPSIIPTAAAMFMFKGFVNPDSGWLNRLFLGPLGLAGLNQLYTAGGEQAFFLLASLWAIGPGFLVIMSSLEAIPNEIHEAAQMDGANLLQHFFGITVPLVSPAIFFTLILNLTATFAGSILLDRGDTFSGTYKIAISSYDSYLHYVLFDMQKLGYASSLGWMFFAFVLIIVLALFATAKYWVYFPDEER